MIYGLAHFFQKSWANSRFSQVSSLSCVMHLSAQPTHLQDTLNTYKQANLIHFTDKTKVLPKLHHIINAMKQILCLKTF